MLNANGEIAMETQSTSAVLDIDGNPHSDAMNKPTQNGMREVDLSTTKEGNEYLDSLVQLLPVYLSTDNDSKFSTSLPI